MLLNDILLEMNVANLDDIKRAFTAMLSGLIAQRGLTVSAIVFAMIVKRAIKAMQNDEAGNMVVRQRYTMAPEDAPKWLVDALARGDEVYHIDFKDGFETRLAHVVDWMAADEAAINTIRAVPDADFLGHIAKAADDYYATQKRTEVTDTTDEAGREVIMTFRLTPTSKTIQHYNETTLANDPRRGPVVAFWCKLTGAESLNREGQKMRHCVGDYCNLVNENRTTIFSLRDAKNEPHTTVELNMRVDPPQINQVKGYANRPPVGKYAPFVRDFLNELGIKASNQAASDIQGLGLLTHDGKYGTILEVGGDILATFDNGDTLRALAPEAPQWRFRGGKAYRTCYYVEKQGTMPFQFEVLQSIQPPFVSNLHILRQEKSRYPLYAKNLRAYFTQQAIKTVIPNDVFAELDLYYDDISERWGSAAELSEKVLDHKGVTATRFLNHVLFSYRGAVFMTAGINKKMHIILLKRKVGSMAYDEYGPAGKLIPELLVAYYTKFGIEPYGDEEKALFMRFGLFSTAKGLAPVPDDRMILTSKHGSVRHYRFRLFFYNPQGKFIGSVYVGKGTDTFVAGHGIKTIFTLEEPDVTTIARKPTYWLISDLTLDPKLWVRVKHFNVYSSKTADLGFFEKQGKLLPVADVAFKTTIKDFTVEMTAGQYDRSLMISRQGQILITVNLDQDDVVQTRNATRKDAELRVEYRAILAAALNVAKAKMYAYDVLRYGLTLRGDKYYPQPDPQMLQIAIGNPMDLGNGFRAALNLDSMKIDKDDRPFDRFGQIEYFGTSVVYLKWSDSDKTELSYQMPKRLPARGESGEETVSRQEIIRAATKFMRIFHQKIEPYLGKRLMGSGSDNQRDDD